MICDKLPKCADYLECYRKIGRVDIAEHYATNYCHNRKHVTCKRNEFFNINKEPGFDITPNGDHSVLIRWFK